MALKQKMSRGFSLIDEGAMGGIVTEETDLLGSSRTTYGAALSAMFRAIERGTTSFLFQQYSTALVSILLLASLIFAVFACTTELRVFDGAMVSCAFLIGGGTSIVCGWSGIKAATTTAPSTTFKAYTGESAQDAFDMAFSGASVLGFLLPSIGLLTLYGTFLCLSFQFVDRPLDLAHNAAAYGLGASCVALFGRLSGGIFAKAADLAADLSGKLLRGMAEDDRRNAAMIADNVGDNVSDVAGSAADLMSSFANAMCAAVMLGVQQSPEIAASWEATCFPLSIAMTGLLSGLISHPFVYFAHVHDTSSSASATLRTQLFLAALVMLVMNMLASLRFIPVTFVVSGPDGTTATCSHFVVAFCVGAGIVAGLGVGWSTEYYTSVTGRPVRRIAHAANVGGAATTVIRGLALGYESTIVPSLIIALLVATTHTLANLYGVALAACGMLSTGEVQTS
jgi:H(+)-translocating pyrophosphatase